MLQIEYGKIAMRMHMSDIAQIPTIAPVNHVFNNIIVIGTM